MGGFPAVVERCLVRTVPAFSAILLSAGLVVSLAACSPSGSSDGGSENAASGDCDTLSSGALSDGVTVEGDIGAKPTVEFESPLTAGDTTQRTVVIEGDGTDVAEEGTTALVDFAVYNGRTGEEVSATAFDGQSAEQIPMDEEYPLAGMIDTIRCSVAGYRLVGVIPPAEFNGGQANPTLGLEADDSIVFVVDVEEIQPAPDPALERADGEDQPVDESLPTVTLAEDGAPTIEIPETDPPAELEIGVLKKGDGPEVAQGADVVVHYTGVKWADGSVFDSSWDRGEPTTFNTAQVIPGFTAALEGQTVSSQVIAVIPPDQGYGEDGAPQAGIAGTDTLVFVVDILGLG